MATQLELKDRFGRTIAKGRTSRIHKVLDHLNHAHDYWKLVMANMNGKNYTGYVKDSDLEGLNVSTVAIPANFAGLEAVSTPTRLEDQYFEITEVIENEDYVEVTAEHIFYRMRQNYTLWKPTENTQYTGAAALRNIMTNAVSELNFDAASDCTDTLQGSELDFDRKNVVEALLDPNNGLCAKYGLSLIRDNDVFYCLKEVGYDRGLVIQNEKNLLGVERKESIENVVTRVAPIGKTAKGDIVWLNYDNKKYIDSQYISDYAEPKCEIYDTGLQIGKDDVTEQNIQAKLLEAAQKRFTEDKVDIPELTMTIEFISLGDTEEYAQYRDLDKVYLYDILTIKDTVRGYNYSAQVIGVEHDILTGMLLSVKIGSITNADDTRKIATWQVPEIDGSNIRLKSIMAGSFEGGAIQADDIGNGAIATIHLAAATIDDLTADSITAVTARIHEIIAGSITADDIVTGSLTSAVIAAGAITAEKIGAGAVTTEKLAADSVTAGKILAGAITTEKLDAGAVTAAKIDAGAVTTDKLDAGAVTANKISTTDLSAIQAKLQIADIADAHIASADIGYAQVKELNAQSAYFGQAVIQAGLANKLYVPRLAVGYAQMIGATIGDLVIQASNGNYYGIDVDLDGNVTATQRTVTAEEIASGHTTDGRQLVLGTDILAEDLNTNNLTASHALMYSVTANIIDVDQLWARQAFINKLMVQDISSNTYIQSTIGNWTSSSTITQTINGLDSRISSLGYGTVYMQPEEPDHSHLTSGDIWIQTLATGTWQDIYDNHATWQEIYNTYDSWQVIGSIPQMWVWDGIAFQLMYDAYLPDELTTEIQQLANQITLLATKTQVDALSGEVSEFAATLAIQAEQIEAAVSAVNTKASTYVMYADPRTAYTVTLGDIWVRQAPHTQTWQDIYDSYSTWNELYSTFDAWKEFIGDVSYVWDGSKWVMTSDRAEEIMQRTDITQTATAVTILAETTATLQGDQVRLSSQLTVANDRISAEVERATTAEAGKISKTSQYQTADDIVSEAVSEAGTSASNSFIAKTTTYQSAQAIVNTAVSQAASSASGLYLAKTQTYQTADSIVTEAVRQAATSAASAFIAKTSSYQSATSIVTEAVRQSGVNAAGTYLAKTSSYQTVADIIADSQAKADAAATSAKNASIAKTSTYQSAQAIVNTAVAQAATAAGQAYIAKTNTYQTADAIVTEAVRQSEVSAAGAYITRTTNYQTVDDILAEAQNKADAAATTAKNASIAKTTTYQSAQSIVNAAVAAAETSAGNTYIAKTQTYQTADAIVSAANTYTNGQLSSYSTTTQTSTMISQYVGENAYGKVSGIAITSSGVDISGSQYVKIASGGYLQVKTGNFGIDTNSSGYVMWAGAATAADSYFRVKKNGEVTVTKLMILNEQGTESEFNLNTGGLWKLNYRTVKNMTAETQDGQTTLTLQTSNGDLTVNFNSAASVTVTGATLGSLITGTVYNLNVNLSNGSIKATTVDCFHPIDSVDVSSVGNWSGGTATIYLTNQKTSTVSMPDSASWSKTSLGTGNLYTINCTVGGKTYSWTTSF